MFGWALFITCLERHLNDLIATIEEAGVRVQDVMAAPVAAGLVTLSKTQKIAGCILANIGAETVSIAVFENNMPISLEVFPIGSTDITNDIASILTLLKDPATYNQTTLNAVNWSRKYTLNFFENEVKSLLTIKK